LVGFGILLVGGFAAMLAVSALRLLLPVAILP
jgi:hypothetical protein